MTPEQVCKFIKKSLAGKKVDDFELYLQSASQTVIEAKEGKVASFQKARPQGAALRLFVKEGAEWKVGFAAVSAWEESLLERMVGFSYNSLQFLGQDPWNGPSHDAGPVSPWGDSPLELENGLQESRKIETALALERAAKGVDNRIARVRKAEYQEERVEAALFRAQEPPRSYVKTIFEISLMVMAEDKKDQESAWDTQFADRFDRLDPETLAAAASRKALSLLGARPVATQQVPVLLDPMAATAFLGVLAHSFLAENVQKKKSFLSGKKWGKQGEGIFSKRLDLIDDGLLAGGFRSAPFDGEGIARRRTEVVKAGRVQRLLYDTATSRRDGCASTGNAYRPSFRQPPHLAVSNFFVPAGERTPELLAGEVGSGFWITDLIGVHTVDPFSGDFSVGATGYWIEKGRKAFPVRGVAVAGNLHKMFAAVREVGSDLRFYESVGSPTLCIEAMQISGR